MATGDRDWYSWVCCCGVTGGQSCGAPNPSPCSGDNCPQTLSLVVAGIVDYTDPAHLTFWDNQSTLNGTYTLGCLCNLAFNQTGANIDGGYGWLATAVEPIGKSLHCDPLSTQGGLCGCLFGANRSTPVSANLWIGRKQGDATKLWIGCKLWAACGTLASPLGWLAGEVPNTNCRGVDIAAAETVSGLFNLAYWLNASALGAATFRLRTN